MSPKAIVDLEGHKPTADDYAEGSAYNSIVIKAYVPDNPDPGHQTQSGDDGGQG